MTNSDGKRVSRVLATLFAFDVVLTVWAFGFSRWWFWVFHGLDTEGQDVHGFLRRCGANWAAFALFQLIALLRWRRDAVSSSKLTLNVDAPVAAASRIDDTLPTAPRTSARWPPYDSATST